MADLESKLANAMRLVKLREEQMRAAALSRNAGEIDTAEWDGYAVRYAAAVREWWAWQHHTLQSREALAETHSGSTYVLSS